MRFEAIRPSNVHETKGYSQAVRIGNTLYVSGQVPKDRSDRIVGVGDFEAQARQVYANLRAVLEAAGGSLDDVVKITTFLTRQDLFEDWRRIRAEVFKGEAHPASTLVVVASLSHLDYLVEIEAIAVIDG